MESHYYFDAPGLISWADARVPTPLPLDAGASENILALVNGTGIKALSEVTLLEVHTKVCTHWRDTGMPEHDEAWASDALDELMRWVADGRLLVLGTPPKMAEMAMVYVEQMARSGGRRLNAWDAAHLYQATRWSRELGQPVTLVTSDRDFAGVFEVFPEFRGSIDLYDPNP